MPPLGNLQSLPLFLPENVLLVGILLVIVAGLLPQRSRLLAAGLTLLVCAAGIAATALTAGTATGIFGGLLARDPFADFFKYLSFLATAAVALLALGSPDTLPRDGGRRDAGDAHEFYALLLGAALGVNLMAASTDLLLAYLSLELVSIMSYVLAGFTRGSRRSAEASLKYVIYGGVASGAMLYGMSLLYGLAASTDLATIRTAAAAAPAPVVVAAVVLAMAGLGYKIAMVPFHMWCPDVYEGAPTPVTGFLSIAPKAGGIALLLRFFADAVPETVAGRSPWVLFLLVVAVATMTVGNLAALAQENIKRLLAYSSIAHAGYLLLGIAVGAPAGHAAVLFYLGVYLFMNLAAFTVVTVAAARGHGETLSDWVGLGHRVPLLGLAMAVALFALAGLPPTAGFVGKYYLFAALVERGGDGGGGVYYLVALVAVANSVLSLGYYLRILRALYLERTAAAGASSRPAAHHAALLVALTLPILALGIWWSPLRELATGALTLWSPAP